MSGWNPPPAPGGPPGPYGYGAPGPVPYPPPPPRRSSSAGLVIGLILGIGMIFVLLVVVVVVVLAGNSHSIGTPPPTAGGYTRDYSTESRISSQINSQRSIIRRATDYAIDDVYSAVYESGSDKYLFVGGNGDFDPSDLYREFRSAVNSEISSNVTAAVIPLADAGGDGEAVCASVLNRQSSLSTYSTALCAWATKDTFGTIMPVPEGSLSTSRSYSYGTVATAMRLMRKDLED
ncbi:hypothetical protein Acsp03_51510 [Actinomadura sp. NBRC 104412]|uniref:hypothetical protein n=1 Tax=Actinomadura sp. NBRC 104412 TaxID=3032203 RepID=UPI0024A41CC1|nr:hypothetical protein [Actinomadura sp. NBRC 104412]GLZ07685.1 hypothetical protein Acsp03_51510 [Actinomadura sp. NBRC 104412]